jgi:hypothetical protein
MCEWILQTDVIERGNFVSIRGVTRVQYGPLGQLGHTIRPILISLIRLHLHITMHIEGKELAFAGSEAHAGAKSHRLCRVSILKLQ